MQAALDLDVEDINAYLQRQDALQLLKQMPKQSSKLAAASTNTDTAAARPGDNNSNPGVAAGCA